MSPKRFIAVLFMGTVLVGMFGFVALIIGGGMHFARHIDSLDSMDDQEMRGGDPVQSGRVSLEETYKGISIAGPLNLVWHKDAKVAYEVTGPADLLKRVKTKTENGSLKFWTEKGPFHGDVTITVYGPQPTELSMLGSGEATLDNLDGGSLSIAAAGSGSANLQGSIAELTASVAGSGDIEADQLVCDKVTANIAGSGNMSLNVKSNLDVSILGSGNVTYKGSPAISKSIAGSGRVEHED